MSSMSYCVFENTYGDLIECQTKLEEAGNVENLVEEVNQYEKKYVKSLVDLCKEIADRFAD